VFGVKQSLIVDIGKVSDFEGYAEKFGVPKNTRLLQYDFVLVTEQETSDLRDLESLKAAKALGLNVKLENGALVLDK
jgi:hypothetical protein